MRNVSREDELRYRLDEHIESLTDEDIAQLQQLNPVEGWPPETASPTRRVERVLLLLEEVRRAEVDEHDVASGTVTSMRAHLLARIASTPEEIREIDPLHDAGA
jgi:hypothetical protein